MEGGEKFEKKNLFFWWRLTLSEPDRLDLDLGTGFDSSVLPRSTGLLAHSEPKP